MSSDDRGEIAARACSSVAILSIFICWIGNCAPGIDEPYFGNTPVGGPCSQDVECFSMSGCTSGRCEQQGTFPWQWGSAQNDAGWSVVVDSEGSVVVTGSTSGDLDGNPNLGKKDAFLSKFSSAGTRLWTKQFGSSGNDLGVSVAAGPSGSIYVVGYIHTDDAQHDAFVAQFSPEGEQIWLHRFGTPDHDSAVAIAVDDQENLYIAGAYHALPVGSFEIIPEQTPEPKAFLSKYSSTGNLVWSHIRSNHSEDRAVACAIDPNGDVLVGGYFRPDEVVFYYNSYLSKYSPAGVELWTKLWDNELAGELNSIQGIAVDSQSNVYSTGLFALSDGFLIKWSPQGEEIWSHRWGGPLFEWPLSVAAIGDVLVVSGLISDRDLDPSSIFLVTFDENGSQGESKTWGSSSVELGGHLAVDQENTIYIIGNTYGDLFGRNRGRHDLVLIKEPPQSILAR